MAAPVRRSKSCDSRVEMSQFTIRDLSSQPSQPSQPQSSSSIPSSIPSLFASEDSTRTTLTSGDSRIQSNVADTTPSDPPPFLGYYKDVDWSRITGRWGPAPGGKGKGNSSIWDHGWRIADHDTDKIHWLCRRCYVKRSHGLKPFPSSTGTTSIHAHLKSKHGITQEKETLKRTIAQVVAEQPTFTEAVNKYYTRFNPAEFRSLLITWIIHDNQAFQAVDSLRFRALLGYLQPAVERFNYMPGRITIRRWIKTGYHNSLPLIQQAIDTSQSKIHCSFDIWTSRKMVAFCGIHIHFLYKGKYKSLLLALPRQVGTHSGVNIAAGIMEVFNSFRITSDRIGYFVSDNAHPNNTCMEELAIRLEFSYDERRLRCAGHIINLIAEVMLRGQDKKAVEPEDDSSVDADADAVALKVLQMFRKRGPPGKLHNVIVWICRSSTNRERLHEWQLRLGLPIHELIRDNTTRWNSAFNSFKRAIEQRGPIEGMLDEELRKWHKLKANYDGGTRSQKPPEQPAIIDDYLTADDWSMIIELMKLLEPLEQATQRLQGHGDGSSHGSIWQVIPCFEGLLTFSESLRAHYKVLPPSETLNVTIEESQDPSQRPTFDPELPSTIPGNSGTKLGKSGTKSGQRKRSSRNTTTTTPSTRAPLEALPTPSQDTSQAYPSQGPLEIPEETDPRRDRQIICTNINLGWGKLMKYYTKTDLSAAYVAALILHPRYNWSWLKKKWCHRVDWLTAADDRMRALWQSYSTFPLPQRPTRARAQPQQRTGQLNLLWSDDEDDDSEQEVELEEYAAWIERAQVKDIYRPLEYWTSKHASSQWPRLSRLAVDIFTIPAMSDDPERTFSSAGLMVRPHRGLLKDDSITETQYLKNWLKGDMVTMAVFASQMEEETTPIQGDDDDDEVAELPEVIVLE
ncbi:MAG: Uncharacterized protein AUREO_060260 [Aureobasidium pullulans]